MSFTEDPFYLVQKEVQSTLKETENLFSSWLRILKTVKNLHNEEFKNVTKEINESVDNIKESLNDLQDSIDVAKDNKTAFQIKSSDLKARQKYILDTRKKLEKMENALSDPGDILLGIKKQEKNPSQIIEMDTFQPYSDEPSSSSNLQLSAQNAMIIEQQDQQLDNILGTVSNLKQIAHTVNDELDLHAEMLDEIDTRMDRTQDKLSSAIRKVRVLGERAGNVKSSILIPALIVILSILAFILFFVLN